MLVTLRYVFKMVGDDKLRVSFITATEDEHRKLQETYCLNDDIVSCGSEYVCSYDVSKIGIFNAIKSEVKNEKV